MKGRDLLACRSVATTSIEIGDALKDNVRQIVAAVKATLKRHASELSADIIDRSIVLCGGGAMIVLEQAPERGMASRWPLQTITCGC